MAEKVIQFQIPIFSEGTKGDLILCFDDVIADALELGALRTESVLLTDEQGTVACGSNTAQGASQCDENAARILPCQQARRQRLARPSRDECGVVSW